MDLATILGLVIAVVGLVGGYVMDKGALGALIQPPAMLIVFGGTIGATLLSNKMKSFTSIIRYLRIAFMSPKRDPRETIEQLVDLATMARREGILALEDHVDSFEDPFIRNGIRLIVDGIDPELVKEMLETEISYIEQRHEVGINLFESAAGFAPTMGIIGTVMGLVHVLGSLSDVSKLGPEIATAFIATLYGVASANVFWMPIGNKLRVRSHEEILEREMSVEGILSIQAGENPNVLRQKLMSFLAASERTDKKAGVSSGAAQEA
ncbi:chemotaxis protein MotA [Alicyclobacillus sacchari]|uniref:Chemotaxis protein MotA n=1 Tax=Alicyclobacillus sacchari TaxID=392010 RepID=A0A4R8LK73_9BACL|nr:flagellar motor protein [Alicyclobacillus sacchari]TDY44510.1 chemotaxis protein MotA [Alicyclobacillus sacchari]